jgi:hypothetical protein
MDSKTSASLTTSSKFANGNGSVVTVACTYDITYTKQ